MELGVQLLTDMFGLIKLEVTVVRLVEVDHDRHDLAHSELTFSKSTTSTVSNQ